MQRIFILVFLILASSGAAFHAAGSEPAGGETERTGPSNPELATFTSEAGKLFIEADVLEMTPDGNSFAASGNVRAAWGDTIVTADYAIGRQREVYIEGNVRMVTPSREMQCERAFINWASGEVVFEEFNYRSLDKTKPSTWYVATPLGMRLADGTILADRATVSTCDYAVPHHYIRARKLIVKPNNDIIAKGVTYWVHGVPMPFYLPAIILPENRPSFDLRVGNSSEFGTFVTLDTSFGLPLPIDSTGTVTLGYFSERGFGWGLGLEYDHPLVTRGEAEYFTMPNDAGEDFSGQTLGTQHRYRYKWIHSMDSPAGWELDIELQKYSDAGFRKEFFDSEYYRDKPIENRIYVKRSKDNWMAFIEGKIRLNEYLDQTERLPVAGLYGLAEPLPGGFLLNSESEFGFFRRRLSAIRMRPGDTAASFNARRRKWNAFQNLPPITPAEELGEDRTIFRWDSVYEVSRPFPLNRFKLEPFVGVQGTYYSERLRSDRDVWRRQLFYGGRMSTALYRYFGITSKPLDINGVRHIIVPDIAYVARTTTRGALATDLIQFDDVDMARQQDFISLRLRNKFQTRRNGRTVDLLDLDLETEYFPHSNRDNNGESFSPLRVDARLRPVDGLSIFTNANYDFSENNRGLAFLNVGASIDVSDRWSSYIGHTYERGLDSFGTYSLAYRMTPKWAAVVSYDRDWRSGESLEESVELIRDCHAFNFAIIVENDERAGEQSVSFALTSKAIKMPPRPGSFVRNLAEARDDEE